MTEPNLEPPTGAVGDTAHLLGRAGLSLIPVLGGTAVEVFNALIQPPIEQRKNEWQVNVAETLKLLKERLVKLEDLAKKDYFIDAVFQTSRIAIANNEKEKIEALKNALFNVGINDSPDRALQQIYFNYIDDFSGLHLKLLKLAKSLPEAFKAGMSEFSPGSDFANFLDNNIPELKNKSDVRDVIWADLYSRKLVNFEGLVPGKRLITTHGANFVLFIEKS